MNKIINNYELLFKKIVTTCNEITQRQVRQDTGFEPLYLYFKEATETENGELIFLKQLQEVPRGFKLAHNGPLKCNVPYENYWMWIRDKSVRLPLLATNRLLGKTVTA